MSISYSPNKFIIRGRDSYRSSQNMSRNSDSETSDYNEEENENSQIRQRKGAPPRQYRQGKVDQVPHQQINNVHPNQIPQGNQVGERQLPPLNTNEVYPNQRQLSTSTSQSPSKVQNINSENVNESLPGKALLLIVCVICAAGYVVHYVKYTDTTEKTSASIDGLKQIFPNQPNETFDDFETIIDEIVFEKAIHPAVFLFLYETNEQKASNLVNHLAKYASQKLRTNQDYIDVHSNEFNSNEALNDYGYLINKYRSDLIERKVMVVKNLHHIPGQTAQVFHSFCDEISPLVERVVYIFTLKVDSLVGKEEKLAEKNLQRVWNELDSDTLMPLITRVTSMVLKILN